MAAWDANTNATPHGLAAASRDAANPSKPPRDRRGLLGTVIGGGFWLTLIGLVVSACVAPGLLVFGLLPLAGMPYLLFCWIAWTGDRDVE
jgi:hypothetical protein